MVANPAHKTAEGQEINDTEPKMLGGTFALSTDDDDDDDDDEATVNINKTI